MFTNLFHSQYSSQVLKLSRFYDVELLHDFSMVRNIISRYDNWSIIYINQYWIVTMFTLSLAYTLMIDLLTFKITKIYFQNFNQLCLHCTIPCPHLGWWYRCAHQPWTQCPKYPRIRYLAWFPCQPRSIGQWQIRHQLIIWKSDEVWYNCLE